MAYICTDCSYRGSTSGQDGRCPACDSPNYRRAAQNTDEKPAPSKWRLAVLVLLWGYLVGLIGTKLWS